MSAHESTRESVLVLEPGRTEKNYWIDLWRYRELFLILAWRDISIRYKQTVIGVAWAVIRPVLNVAAFTLVFNRVAKMSSDGDVPYPLLVFAGMLPWTLFANSLTESSASLINNSNLISKVYFPRMIMPSATVVTAFVDYLISLVIMVMFMAYYRFVPSWTIVMLPFFSALAVLVSLGPGLWTTALSVKYRDFRHVIPFLVQFGSYISPVGFSMSKIPSEWRLVYSLNPMVGVIDGFRWCILGSEIYWPGFVLSLSVGLLLLWLGVSRFRKMERTFADLI